MSQAQRSLEMGEDPSFLGQAWDWITDTCIADKRNAAHNVKVAEAQC